MKTIRHQLTPLDIAKATENVTIMTAKRLREKGYGSFVSVHEILGVLDEELYEYRTEVHSKSKNQQLKIDELIDIAVGAIIGIASIESGGTD